VLGSGDFVGQAQAKVEFKKTPHGGGEKITCSRDGVLIYELVRMGGEKDSEKRMYEFYWKGKKAIQLLKVGRSATIQTYPMTEVSYSVDLDSDGELRGVTVEDGNGKVLDGLLRKKDGRLWPADPPPGTGQ
jgi:hypothetical protein